MKTYQNAIGCLNYATLISQTDVAVAVGVLSKFMSNPRVKQWKGVKRIFRYIQGTINYGLLCTPEGSEPVLSGYCDADWGGDLTTRFHNWLCLSERYLLDMGNDAAFPTQPSQNGLFSLDKCPIPLTIFPLAILIALSMPKWPRRQCHRNRSDSNSSLANSPGIPWP